MQNLSYKMLYYIQLYAGFNIQYYNFIKEFKNYKDNYYIC